MEVPDFSDQVEQITFAEQAISHQPGRIKRPLLDAATLHLALSILPLTKTAQTLISASDPSKIYETETLYQITESSHLDRVVHRLNFSWPADGDKSLCAVETAFVTAAPLGGYPPIARIEVLITSTEAHDSASLEFDVTQLNDCSLLFRELLETIWERYANHVLAKELSGPDFEEMNPVKVTRVRTSVPGTPPEHGSDGVRRVSSVSIATKNPAAYLETLTTEAIRIIEAEFDICSAKAELNNDLVNAGTIRQLEAYANIAGILGNDELALRIGDRTNELDLMYAGNDHHYVAALDDLNECLEQWSQIDPITDRQEARDLIDKMISVEHRFATHAGPHGDVTIAAEYLVATWSEQVGDHANAATFYRKRHDALNKIGKIDWGWANDTAGLARSLRCSGRSAEALEVCKEAAGRINAQAHQLEPRADKYVPSSVSLPVFTEYARTLLAENQPQRAADMTRKLLGAMFDRIRADPTTLDASHCTYINQLPLIVKLLIAQDHQRDAGEIVTLLSRVHPRYDGRSRAPGLVVQATIRCALALAQVGETGTARSALETVRTNFPEISIGALGFRNGWDGVHALLQKPGRSPYAQNLDLPH
jgi:hypothetical protein